MSRRAWLLLVITVAVLGLAYLWRDAIERTVIQPLSYVFWVLGVYYDSFPQVVTWILLVVIVALLAFGSLTAEPPPPKRGLDKTIPVQGPIESLAVWMAKARGGIYFKWLVAQRLGILSRGLLNFKSRQSVQSGKERLGGPGWDPPEEVAAYLESGLNGSFADYPRPRWSLRPPAPTPLDLDPEKVIDFIESEVRRT